MSNGMLRVGAEAGSLAENPRGTLCDTQLAHLVRDSSVTAHCHAATALLPREYQGDHRRLFLTSPRPRSIPLDKSFHISTPVTKVVQARRTISSVER